MAKIDVTLINDADGEEWPAEVVVDLPVGLWVDQLVEALGLPLEEDRKPVEYGLLLEGSGQWAGPEDTLETFSLQEGDVVRLRRVEKPLEAEDQFIILEGQETAMFSSPDEAAKQGTEAAGPISESDEQEKSPRSRKRLPLPDITRIPWKIIVIAGGLLLGISLVWRGVTWSAGVRRIARLDQFHSQVAWLPDGSEFVTVDDGQFLVLWDIAQKKTMRIVGGLGWPESEITLSPDAHTLIQTYNGLSGILIHDLQDNFDRDIYWDSSDIWENTLPGFDRNSLQSLAFSPDGSILAVGTEYGPIQFWDAASGDPLRILGDSYMEKYQYVHAMAFTPDGTLLASGGDDGIVRLWDTVTGEELGTLGHWQGSINNLAFSPDGSLLGGTSTDGQFEVLQVDNDNQIFGLGAEEGQVLGLAFSPSRSVVAAGVYDEIFLWDTGSFEELMVLQGHTETVQTLAFSPDGSKIFSSSAEEFILWDLLDRAVHEGRNTIVGVEYAPDGSLVAVADGKNLILWDPVEDTEITRLPLDDKIRSIRFSREGVLAVCTEWETTLWDVQTESQLHTLIWEDENWRTTSTAFSSDGSILANGTGAGNILLWDMNTETIQHVLPGTGIPVIWLSFMNDGDRLMAVYWDETSAYEDGEAIIWDFQSGGWNKTQTQLPESHGSFDSFQISPSGRFTAVINPADTTWGQPGLGVYRLDNGQLVCLCDDLNSYVGLLAFSPDETILAVEIDPGVVLWDAETGEILKKLRRFEGDILQLSFSSDGAVLAVATTEEVTLWDLTALYKR